MTDKPLNDKVRGGKIKDFWYFDYKNVKEVFYNLKEEIKKMKEEVKNVEEFDFTPRQIRIHNDALDEFEVRMDKIIGDFK